RSRPGAAPHRSAAEAAADRGDRTPGTGGKTDSQTRTRQRSAPAPAPRSALRRAPRRQPAQPKPVSLSNSSLPPQAKQYLDAKLAPAALTVLLGDRFTRPATPASLRHPGRASGLLLYAAGGRGVSAGAPPPDKPARHRQIP